MQSNTPALATIPAADRPSPPPSAPRAMPGLPTPTVAASGPRLRSRRSEPRRTFRPFPGLPLLLLAVLLAPVAATAVPGSPASTASTASTTSTASSVAPVAAAGGTTGGGPDAPAAGAEAAPPPPQAQPESAVDPAAAPSPPDAAADVRPSAATSSGRAPRPEIPRDRPLRVAFLVVDGVYNTELTAPYDVFHHTPFHTGPLPGLEVFTVSPDGEPVTTFEGLVLHPDHGFDDAPPADVLVVPSAEGSMEADLRDERMIAWVREAGARARWVVSLCDGAFVLAQAGLLDGHAATTFPKDYDAFAQRFPAVDLRVNVSFVHDGKALTSQGGVRSFDVALYLVDLLYGEEVARRVGSGLLIPWPLDRDVYLPFSVVLRPVAAEGEGGN